MTEVGALVRLLQLVSPALPVGAYSYSQGLESAIDAGVVADAESAERWIGDVLAFSVERMEAPILLRLMEAWKRGSDEAAHWNAQFVASRETSELRAETLQMGFSLRKLLVELDPNNSKQLEAIDEIAFPAAFAFASTAWRVPPRDALAGYLFAWLENQVLCAVKTIPLGQTDGQRMLRALAARIDAVVECASRLGDDELCNFATGLAIASARHETQYSRMFRS